ncbi:MAG: YigZ family protein [Euryarchaeota archaeon]|nr:YigZ family protein [Euryarchaeota archaeon]
MNTLSCYKTLEARGTSRKEFRNSIFIGYAEPVGDEAEARAFIKRIKEEHSDATHNVSAYLIKDSGELATRYDDDGEPTGSSGKPVFRVLELKGLSRLAVVVTRYFGGIKLGFGGLSRAYRETAIEAIENAGIVEVHETVRLTIRCDYPDAQAVRRLVMEYGSICTEDYSDAVEFVVELRVGVDEEFVCAIQGVTGGRVKV